MKKIIWIWLVSAVGMAACEKEIDTYSGESGIYFDTQSMYSDTLFVSWGLKNSEITEQKIRLKVCLYGNTAAYDRKFNVEVTTEAGADIAAQEGVDYRRISTEHVMPANQAEAYIDVDLLRSSHLKDQPKRFKIALVENEELRFIYTREGPFENENGETVTLPLDYHRVIYMDESFPRPGWWSIYGQSFFGDWTATKAALICDVMGIDREQWMKTDGTGLTQGYLKFVGKYMHRWLQEQNPPVMDENDEPMEMGTASKN